MKLLKGKLVGCLVFFVLGMSLSSASYAAAGWQGGSFKVSSLRVSNDGVYIKFSPAPTACNGGSQYGMHARVRHTVSQNYDSLMSTLLSAYSAEHTFDYLWYNELPTGASACSNLSGEILELTMIKLENK